MSEFNKHEYDPTKCDDCFEWISDGEPTRSCEHPGCKATNLCAEHAHKCIDCNQTVCEDHSSLSGSRGSRQCWACEALEAEPEDPRNEEEAVFDRAAATQCPAFVSEEAA